MVSLVTSAALGSIPDGSGGTNSKTLSIRWHHCPVTAVHFVSKTKLLIGSANQLQLYDSQIGRVIHTWHFRQFTTIHHLELKNCEPFPFFMLILVKVSGSHFAIAVGGCRFYAGLASDSSLENIAQLWTEYCCDNIVHCSISLLEADTVCFFYLSAHGEIFLVRTNTHMKEGFVRIGEVTTSRVKSTMCYSGAVVGDCRLKGDCFKSVSFTGSTFGCIEIDQHFSSLYYFTSYFFELPEGKSLPDLSSFWKGAVFSIAIVHSTSTRFVRLVSAAEDRSIAIWTRALDDVEEKELTVDRYLGPWVLSNLLVAGSPDGDVIFEARIWRVFANDLGLLASGEDCRIVWYPWDSLQKKRIITGVHRGHGVWCVHVWTLNSDGDLLVVSGGNDGAVCISAVPHNQLKETSVFLSPRHANGPDNVAATESQLQTADPGNHDFVRCLFFGPTGRLFYLTDRGHFHTAEVCWSENPSSAVITLKPLFCRAVVKQLRGEVSQNDVDVFHSAEPDELVQSDGSPSSGRFFRGYTVSATNRSHTLTAIGDKQGQLGLFQVLTDTPYLACTDLRQLGRKVMNLTWLDESDLLIGLQNGPASFWFLTSQVLLTVVRSVENSGLFIFSTKKRCLCFPPGSEMRWASTGCVVLRPCSDGLDLVTTVVVGTRDGGLYSYTSLQDHSLPSCEHPQWLMECCHGRGGCTTLATVFTAPSLSTIISCGRSHGELRLWHVTLGGNLVLIGLIPSCSSLTWVDRFYQTADNCFFALGFQSANFKAYLLGQSCGKGYSFSLDRLNRRALFRVNCGGGNRYWEWWVPTKETGRNQQMITKEPTSSSDTCLRTSLQCCSSGRFPILATVHRGDVILHSFVQRTVSPSLPFSPLYLRPSLHGRDVNCCLMFSVPLPDAHISDPLTALFCFAGGESTDLSSWALKADTLGRTDVTYHCSPEHHRGHISNIRCLSVPVILETHKTIGVNGLNGYMISGGGRGQIGIWRINLTDSTESSWRPGWLGSIRLALVKSTFTKQQVEFGYSVDTGTQEFAGDQSSSSKSISPRVCRTTDLRVMAIVSVEICQLDCCREPIVLTVAACSDGSIRLIAILPPTEVHPRSPKFIELGGLHQLASNNACPTFTPKCYLDMKLLESKCNQLVVIASNSDGECECWSVQWSDNLLDADELNATFQWSLISRPVQPFYKDTHPAFNCLDIESQKQILFVGADDGSLRVARISSQFNEPIQPEWLISETCHFAAIVRLAVLPTTDQLMIWNRVVTLAADHRLILWQFSIAGNRETVLRPLQRSILPGIGDPHGLALNITITDDSSKRPNWLLATGIGSFLIQI
ncbi:WD domain, G-beta repeat protein [Opisthorchis viverrini]|uniref:WD domain, G-beta repeat protein n=1 Tax=Opisthorchis viverrini TaxID=6198 RepID=A0A1S8X830_OPIVI|nr:WD domain, G-beta repeat protein [Opisthorchis viverrini]